MLGRPLNPDYTVIHCGDSNFREAIDDQKALEPQTVFERNGRLLGVCDLHAMYAQVILAPDGVTHFIFCSYLLEEKKTFSPSDFKGTLHTLEILTNWPVTFIHESFHWLRPHDIVDYEAQRIETQDRLSFNSDDGCFNLANRAGPKGKRCTLKHAESYTMFVLVVNLPDANINMKEYGSLDGTENIYDIIRPRTKKEDRITNISESDMEC